VAEIRRIVDEGNRSDSERGRGADGPGGGFNARGGDDFGRNLFGRPNERERERDAFYNRNERGGGGNTFDRNDRGRDNFNDRDTRGRNDSFNDRGGSRGRDEGRDEGRGRGRAAAYNDRDDDGYDDKDEFDEEDGEDDWILEAGPYSCPLVHLSAQQLSAFCGMRWVGFQW